MLKEKPLKKGLLVLERKYLLYRSVEHPTYKANMVPLCILEDNTNIYETFYMQHFCSMTHIYFSTNWKDTSIFLQQQLNWNLSAF